MRSEQILDVLTEKRHVHPELHSPLTWEGLRRVLARERVPLRIVSLERPAKLAHVCGEWTIFLNKALPPRRYTYFAAHELAHLWLHVDLAGIDRWETVFHADEDYPDDEEEDDAEFMAMCMLHEVRIEQP